MHWNILKQRPLWKMLFIKVILLALIAGIALLFGDPPQPSAVQAASPIQQSTAMIGDLWFWIFVGWYIFSALVSGMPEPTQSSSPWYIWAYRSFHILAASGTSFFQNKLFWPSAAETTVVVKKGSEN